MKRAIVAVVWALAAGLVGTGCFVAGRWTAVPREVTTSDVPSLTVAATTGTLGWTQTVPVVAEWDYTAQGATNQSGTITEIVTAPGTQVDEGTALYRIDQRPVVVARGEVPMYRDLSAGASGTDVAQLQAFLTAQGHGRLDTNGTFGSATTAAVKAWQRSLNVPADGVVIRSDLLFVAQLPVVLTYPDGLRVGSLIAPGDPLAFARSATPALFISLSTSQLTAIPCDRPVLVTYQDRTWEAVVTSTEADNTTGEVRAWLAAPAGGPVCADQCAEIPGAASNNPAILQGAVVLVPETTGTMVPRAAVGINARGDHYVVSPDGTRIEVDVLVSADGQAIVEGLEPGQQVRVYGDQ